MGAINRPARHPNDIDIPEVVTRYVSVLEQRYREPCLQYVNTGTL